MRSPSTADLIAALDDAGVLLWARRDPRTDRVKGFYWAHKGALACKLGGTHEAHRFAIHGAFGSQHEAAVDAAHALNVDATDYATRILCDEVTAIRAHPIGAPLPPGWCLAEAVDGVVSIGADGTVMIRRGGLA
jgi:hypothetical protein